MESAIVERIRIITMDEGDDDDSAINKGRNEYLQVCRWNKKVWRVGNTTLNRMERILRLILMDKM